MLTIDGKPYINLDEHLPLDTLPHIDVIKGAIADSYDLITANTWQQNSLQDGTFYNCTWFAKEKTAKTKQEFFELELKNDLVSPYWILNLTENHDRIVYDSIECPADKWDQITLKDIPDSWAPMLKWIDDLECFAKRGRICALLTRPGLAPQFHRDTGHPGHLKNIKPHREEFIWFSITQDKTFVILDEEDNNKIIPITSQSAFFNHSQMHGASYSPPYWQISFNIEGAFTEEFRKKIGIDHIERYHYENV